MSRIAKPVAPIAVSGLPRDTDWSAGAIVEGLKGRDPAAATALYQRCGERINRLVWRLLGADAEQSDVVHQVFINVLASIDRLNDVQALDSWISSVTVNTVRREIRNRGYRRIVGLSPTRADHTASPENPEHRMFLNRFYAALEHLPADDQIAFSLHLLNGDTLQQVANTVGCSMATVKRRVARAKKAFEAIALRDPVLASYRPEAGDDP